MPTGAPGSGKPNAPSPGDGPTLVHLVGFDDTCTHMHIDVAYAASGLAAANLTTAYARQ